MKKKDITEVIENLLQANRLNVALETLRSESDRISPQSPALQLIRREIDRIEETYRYMQEYLLKGVEDKGRDALFSSLREKALQQAVNLSFVDEIETSPKEFYSALRLHRLSRSTLADLLEEYGKDSFRIEKAGEVDVDPARIKKHQEELLDRIFRCVWTAAPWEADTTARIREVMLSSDGDFTLRAQTLSALMLSLLEFYDSEKIAILLDAYSGETDERMAARMLTVIIPVVNRWRHRIQRVPELIRRLEEISDSILTYTRLRDIVMTMVRTRDTDRVSSEIKETFNIAMKNIPQDLLDKMRKEGINMEAGELGGNPEWDRFMKENNLEQRFMDINEMQMQGMDVMMESFGRLKTFPFFREIGHWFLPFSETRSEIKDIFGSFDATGLADAADMMGICGSDRYSFAFGFESMPKERRDMIVSSLGMVNDMVKDQFKDDVPRKNKSTFASESLNYARDLYRFFKLFPRKNQFFDIFANPIDFLSLPVIGAFLEEDEILNLIGNFYFEYGYYDLALPMLEKATQGGVADMQIYEKIGYCLQMTGNIPEALANYMRADLFSTDATPPSAWLLRKLAFCHRVLRDYGAAAEYYRRLLERNPDDSAVETHLGAVLLMDGQIDEAMTCLSKVHYLDPDNKSCAQHFVKGLIMRGDNPEDAYSAAVKLTLNSPNDEDNRLAGHASLLAGHIREAANFYAAADSHTNPQPPAEDAKGISERQRKTIIDEINFLAPKRFDPLTLDILLDL